MSHDQEILEADCTEPIAAPAVPALPEPEPRVAISIRLATMEDIPALDALQKKHGKALGFFPRAQMEGYVRNEWVLIAQDDATGQVLGYCASRDRYLKRDELGIIYQLCVNPGAQRKLVGAALVREVFERSAYGCRLFCCWCAQDLEANHFWEAMGFVPLAFRAGSDKKRRVHIFWQKRIVEGDEQTRWWYPFQTSSGAIRQDRLVFPIPPGTHWTEVTAVAVPTESPHPRPSTSRCAGSLEGEGVARRKPKPLRAGPPPVRGLLRGFQFASEVKPQPEAPKAVKAKAPKVAPVKINPRFLTAARELRDRYLEQVNDGPGARGLHLARGKYQMTRALPPTPAFGISPIKQRLPLAA
jgi:N-acetylglutamate synthase-like GNAT family acetyltransferase